MGKGKGRRGKAERRRLRSLADEVNAGVEAIRHERDYQAPVHPLPSPGAMLQKGGAELERRPEHIAQMAAWAAAGCPENGTGV